VPSYDEKTIPAELMRLRSAVEGGEANPCLVVLTGISMGSVFRLTERESIIGRGESCAICLDDERVSRQHAKLIRVAGGEVMIQDLESLNGTYKDGRRISLVPLRDGERFHVGGATLLRLSLTEEMEESFRRLYESSIRDGLTGVHNRKFLDDRLLAEFAFAKRHGTPLSVVMFDIDHFKQVNDTHGHQAGDLVLRSTGAVMHASIRAEDIVARYGGEEFAILVPGVDRAQAAVMAERIRALIEEQAIIDQDREIRITVSGGVACTSQAQHESAADLLAAADRALYAAKEAGRNRIVVAE
jgi:diguanylate cyclase (GGDEF)-like protein